MLEVLEDEIALRNLSGGTGQLRILQGTLASLQLRSYWAAQWPEWTNENKKIFLIGFWFTDHLKHF